MVTIISIIIVVALYMMLGIAVVAVAFMLSLFLAIGCADHDDMAVPGFAEEPFHRVDIAVATAHQQQPARHRTGGRRVQLAEDIMFDRLFLGLFRCNGRQSHAQRRQHQQPNYPDERAQHVRPSVRERADVT